MARRLTSKEFADLIREEDPRFSEFTDDKELTRLVLEEDPRFADEFDIQDEPSLLERAKALAGRAAGAVRGAAGAVAEKARGAALDVAAPAVAQVIGGQEDVARVRETAGAVAEAGAQAGAAVARTGRDLAQALPGAPGAAVEGLRGAAGTLDRAREETVKAAAFAALPASDQLRKILEDANQVAPEDPEPDPELDARFEDPRDAERRPFVAGQRKEEAVSVLGTDPVLRNTRAFLSAAPALVGGIAEFGASLTSQLEQTEAGRAALSKLPPVTEIGRAISDKAQDIQQSLLPPDPTFINEVSAGFGSLATFYIGGIGVIRGARSLAVISDRLALWFGISASTVMESAVEAGSTVKEARDRGATDMEAAAAGNVTFGLNLPVIAITNRYGIWNDAPGLKGLFGSALNEGGQEWWQQLVGNFALNDELLQGSLKAGLIGAITGGGFKAVQQTAAAFEASTGDPSEDVIESVNAALAADFQPDPVTQFAGRTDERLELAAERDIVLAEPEPGQELEIDTEGLPPEVVEPPAQEPPAEAEPTQEGDEVDPATAPIEELEAEDAQLDPEQDPVAEAPVGEILQVETNFNDGIEVRIVKGDKGFNIVTKDLDSGEILPAVLIRPTFEEAQLKAQSILEGRELPEPESEPDQDPEVQPIETPTGELPAEQTGEEPAAPAETPIEELAPTAEEVDVLEGVGEEQVVEDIEEKMGPETEDIVPGTEISDIVPETKDPIPEPLEFAIEDRVSFERDGQVLTGEIIGVAGNWAKVRIDETEGRGFENANIQISTLTKIPLTPPAPEGKIGEEDGETDIGTVGPGGPGVLEGAPPAGVPPTGEGGEAPAGVVERGEVDVGGGGEVGGEVAPTPGELPGRPSGEDVEGAPTPAEVIPPAGEPEPGTRVGPTEAAGNYTITAEDRLGLGTPKQKFQSNMEALEILRRLEETNSRATIEDQKKLVRYVGWGGLPQPFQFGLKGWEKEYDALEEFYTDTEWDAARRSTLNAHFTSAEIVMSMYRILEKTGFESGRILEPSMGTGNFFGLMPGPMRQRSNLSGVELDITTARIAQQLYPQASIDQIGYERKVFPNNFFDVAIGNVPFGRFGVSDKEYANTTMTGVIHNYFFAKTLDKVRPGGIVMFITSRFTMDSKNAKARDYIGKRARLLGAMRLPSTAFKGNAGTEVVTDVLILQKLRPGQESNLSNWRDTVEQRDERTGEFYELNKFYVDNPGQMLGVVGYERTQHGFAYTLNADNRTITEAMEDGAETIEADTYSETDERVKVEPAKILAPGELKPNGLVVEEGKLFQNIEGQLELISENPLITKRVGAFLEVRDVVREVQTTQRENASEEDIQAAIAKLNEVYDKTVERFGPVNDRQNRAAIDADPDSALLKALEKQKDKEWIKADIFTKRVIAPRKIITKTDNAVEALTVSLQEFGNVNMQRIRALTGKSEKEVLTDLEGLLWQNPSGGIETSEEYLSGNVKRKLAEAKAAAKLDARFNDNVEALSKVIPEDLLPSEVTPLIGAPWIEPSDIEAFVAHLTDVPAGYEVRYVSLTGDWSVEIDRVSFQLNDSVGNNETWGMPGYSAVQLVRDTLQGRVPTIWDKDADNNRFVNQEATAVARDKQEKIKEEFKVWLYQDDARTLRLLRVFNDTFNTNAPRVYNGDHLFDENGSLPGMNPDIKLRQIQRNAVWRLISSKGNTLIAHEVGVGKTLVAIAAMMEKKRLGLVKKPMAVVKKSIVPGWKKEFQNAYPTANILITEPGDFSKKNRRKIIAKIATGDWDAVIVSIESFGKTPMGRRSVEEFFKGQIRAMENAIEEETQATGARGLSVKQLERALITLEKNMDDQLERLSKDPGVEFENLGVDDLTIDESQEFKNLFVPTRMTRVAGLPTKKGSGRAFDLFMKGQYLQTVNEGKGLTFLTGTPITNTIGEMFVLQKYLALPTLEKDGVASFDAWARMFGEMTSRMEFGVTGGIKQTMKTRFNKFRALQPLLQRYFEFADVVTAAEAGIKVPKIRGGKAKVEVVPGSPELAAFLERLSDRAGLVKRGAVDPKDDNMLKITSDGRKASVDMRLIDPSLEFNPTGKIAAASANIREIWEATKDQKSAQLVFLDMGVPKDQGKKAKEGEELEEFDLNLYADIQRTLVASGIPAGDIEFIHDHEGDAKRAELYRRVNAGEVRVLIGSTGKMGVGVNVQERLVANHHIDAPWRPDWVRQRDGRLVRQGNQNEEVQIFRYVMEGSFDVYSWQTLDQKNRFVEQLKPSGIKSNDVEDIGDVVFEPDVVTAISTGNPIIVEKAEVDNNVSRLRLLESAFSDQQFKAKRDKETLPLEIKSTEERIEAAKEDLATAKKNTTEEFEFTVKGTKHTKRVDAGKAIIALADKMREKGVTGKQAVGKFRGFPIRLEMTEGKTVILTLEAMSDTSGWLVSDSPQGIATSIEKRTEEGVWSKKVEERTGKLASLKKRFDGLDAVLEAEFAEKEELEANLLRQEEITKILHIGQSEPGGDVDADGSALAQAYVERDHDESAAALAAEEGGPADDGPAGSGMTARDDGVFSNDVPVTLAMDGEIRPIQMPEMVRLARELTGRIPDITTRFRTTQGVFESGGKIPGRGQIRLNWKIFEDEFQAAAVLGHEIGHLEDYLGETDLGNTLARGNLIGRLAVLHKFMKQTWGDIKVTNNELREELIALSEAWRPYDKDNASSKFISYRNSSRELYADALSVLLNNPGLLEEKAPKFFQAFMDSMVKKPDVHTAFFKLQDLLSGRDADLLGEREVDLRKMFAKGEDLLRHQRNERLLRQENVYDRLRTDYMDSFTPVFDKVKENERKGIFVPADQNPVFILDESRNSDTVSHLFLDRVNRLVLKPLAEKNVSVEDLGIFLFFQRISNGGRARIEDGGSKDIANPLGHTATTAKAGLASMAENLGADKFSLLEARAQKFHSLVFGSVLDAVELGTYSREVFETQIEPNRHNYSSFAVLDFITENMPPGIKKQVGTFKEIANPLLSTIMKTVALNRLNELQRAKISVRDYWKNNFPDEIKRAKVRVRGDKLRQFKTENPANGVMTMLENGVLQGYEMDPYVAESVEKWKGPDLGWVVNMLQSIKNGIFHPLFITYNIGFAFAFNPIRDFRRTYINSPGVSFGETMLAYMKAIPVAVRREMGVYDPLVEEMIEAKALDIPFNDIHRAENDDQYSELLKRFGFLKEKERFFDPLRKTLLKPIISILDGIRFAGSVIETLSKVAGYNNLKKKGFVGKELAYRVRNHIGTPNWRRRGRSTRTTNAIWLYSNMFVQGYRADLEVASDPNTRAGHWWKRLKIDVLPKYLMMMALAGLMGDELKEFFERVSEYDKTNYTIIPLGWVRSDKNSFGIIGRSPGGKPGMKVMYIRIPHDETGRFIGGVAWKMMSVMRGDSAKWAQLVEFGMGQSPSLTPTIKVGQAWWTYISGENPQDTFRNRPVLRRSENDARGLPALKRMVGWTLEQVGLRTLASFATYNRKEDSTFEATIRALPGINRLIRVTDYGLVEKAEEQKRLERQRRALRKLDMDVAVRQAVDERYRLTRNKESGNLSEEQERRLKDFKRYYRKHLRFMKKINEAAEEGDEAEVRRWTRRLEEAAKDVMRQ